MVVRRRAQRELADIVQTISDPALLGPWFAGPSWSAWHAVLKAAYALPMTRTETRLFHGLAERDPPHRRVKELWIISGRRAGKDSIASSVCTHAAALVQYNSLRPGERALCACLAVDRSQARIVQRYVTAYFEQCELLRPMVDRDARIDGLELSNSADISILSNDYRSVRGRTIACVIMDEVAFWTDSETAVSPDRATYDAIIPGMATLPGAMLIGISTPWRRSGLLYDKWKLHFGQPDDDVLIIKAPSLALNPTLDPKLIEAAIERDPEAARSEWLAEWRSDISSFIERSVVDSCTVPGRIELPPMEGTRYTAFVDPSGGSSDSMTLAIAHREKDCGVLDAIRERKPPFSPEAVVTEFATLLQNYGINSVTGDRYAGEWPRERFRLAGIRYDTSDKVKSDIYLGLVPLLNSSRIELLDIARLQNQLCGLERRAARSGKESVDHPPLGHDDVVNAAAGVLVAVAGKRSMNEIWAAL